LSGKKKKPVGTQVQRARETAREGFKGELIAGDSFKPEKTRGQLVLLGGGRDFLAGKRPC